MAEIQNKRAFEQLEEVRHVVKKLQKMYSEVQGRCQQHKLEQERAAEEQDDITAAGLGNGLLASHGPQWIL